MKGQFLTDRGQVSQHNEDSGGVFYNHFGQLLAIIADGMGGHQAGDIASEMAVSMVQKEWEKSEEIKTPDQAEKWLEIVLFKVNKTIYEEAQKKDEYIGMGTTIVVTINTNDFITISHIGDSRCYIQNDNGFNQITEDHSLVNELLRQGQITQDEASYHPRKNVVLKALGTEEEIEADIRSLSWENGDTLLLCSDGLTDKIDNEELEELMHVKSNLKELGQDLIDLANDRGGEDNISLVVVSHNPLERVGEDSC